MTASDAISWAGMFFFYCLAAALLVGMVRDVITIIKKRRG